MCFFFLGGVAVVETFSILCKQCQFSSLILCHFEILIIQFTSFVGNSLSCGLSSMLEKFFEFILWTYVLSEPEPVYQCHIYFQGMCYLRGHLVIIISFSQCTSCSEHLKEWWFNLRYHVLFAAPIILHRQFMIFLVFRSKRILLSMELIFSLLTLLVRGCTNLARM